MKELKGFFASGHNNGRSSGKNTIGPRGKPRAHFRRKWRGIPLIACPSIFAGRLTSAAILIFAIQYIADISSVFARTTDPFTNPVNRDKIETILRIQDRRSYADRTAVGFFTDTSETVRYRAILAYANLQDSTVLGPLLDRFSNDSSDYVRYVAAFTIGRTALLLSPLAVGKLGHELIWERIDPPGRESGRASDRMVEEIGKFGDASALADLVNRYTTQSPVPHYTSLVMSIARFAIRGITNDDATRWLLTQARNTREVSWQVLYALQRIGKSPITISRLPDILPIYRDNTDPLVLVQYATLLGKLRDSMALDPLGKLAGFDPDWRVRVNAIKALGSFDIGRNGPVLDMLRRCISGQNMMIAFTAVSTLGNIKLRMGDGPEGDRLLEELETVTRNSGSTVIWQLQAEAAFSLARIEGAAAVPIIREGPAEQKPLRAAILIALGTSGSKTVLPLLIHAVKDKDPFIARAALDSLPAIGRKNLNNSSVIDEIRTACYTALESGDVALIATAASILGEPPYRSADAVTRLLNILDHLRVPFDIEALQDVCEALGTMGDLRAIGPLEHQLSQSDRSVMAAAAAALHSLTGKSYSIDQRVEPLHTDFDFHYLESLPETVHVRLETIRGDIGLELYPGVAPFTVMNFLKLASNRGFYRGTTFHRVVPNFVIQGGDPRADGWGGPAYTIRTECSPQTFSTGALGMASSGKDTEGSQFFITQSPQPHLDGNYTLFGKVESGMDVVNRIMVDDRIVDILLVK